MGTSLKTYVQPLTAFAPFNHYVPFQSFKTLEFSGALTALSYANDQFNRIFSAPLKGGLKKSKSPVSPFFKAGRYNQACIYRW
jgi:hypothetical protein